MESEKRYFLIFRSTKKPFILQIDHLNVKNPNPDWPSISSASIGDQAQRVSKKIN